MRVDDALSQIEAIHDQMTKAEVYRGFHAWGVATAGLLGCGAAALEPFVPGTFEPMGFLRYWLIVGLVCGLVAASSALHAYLDEDAYTRRQTRRLMSQFVPCLLAGIVVTIALPRVGEELVALLPGLWSLLFGLGLLAARPYLPRATGWVCLFHLVAGALLLLQTSPQLAGWQVGGVFGIGQLAAAYVLYRNVERSS